jgi:hypothetical protein
MPDTFQQQLAERVEQLARFQAALEANRDRPLSTWVGASDFPYLAAFDRDGVEEFSEELRAHLLDARERGTLENLEGNLRAWESTSEVYQQPEVLAAMTAPINDDDVVEVFPPSLAEVEAARRQGDR